MTPNKFSKLMQHGLGIVEQALLITIAMATIFAVFQAILHIWQARAIAVGDLLLLFLYLETFNKKLRFDSKSGFSIIFQSILSLKNLNDNLLLT